MKAKYCAGHIPRYIQPKLHDAQTWKRMQACCQVMEQYVRWRIEKGELFFWHDCLMGDEPLINCFPSFASSMTKVCEFFTNDEWDVDKLLNVLPKEIVDNIFN